MPGTARINDTISHGGYIAEGSPDCFCNDRNVARLGDSVVCFIHGTVAIATASTTTYANNRGVARLGDLTTCGATITSASTDTYVDE